MAKRKTARKTAKRPVKRTRAKPMLKETKEKTYYGLTYDAWINVILLVAIILIAGILAGVGSLIQKTQEQAPSLVAAPSPDIQVTGARTLAGIVLNKVLGEGNYNITSVELAHGVYRVELTINTPTGLANGTMFISKDGKEVYFRGIPTEELLKR